MNNATLDCALYYISQGWQVIPIWPAKDGHCTCPNPKCTSPGKHPYNPLVPNGAKDATASREVVEKWFGGYRHLNIAVVCGPGSGLVVLDVDPRHDGDESITNFAVPDTLKVATGGGGWHYYFKHPGPKVDVRNSAGALGPGLDVRGFNGYVLAPPSNHVSGATYRWMVDPRAVTIAPCPNWILHQDKHEIPTKVLTECGGKIPVGQQEARLCSLAGTMRRRGMEPPEILAALREISRAKPRLAHVEMGVPVAEQRAGQMGLFK